LPEYRQHLKPREEAQHRPLEALHRHRQRPLHGVQRRHIAAAGELQERAHRRQTKVAAAHRVVPRAFQVVEEGQD
jgi:hypothetical protein